MDDFSGHYELLKRQVRELYAALLKKDYEGAVVITESVRREAAIVGQWAQREIDREPR